MKKLNFKTPQKLFFIGIGGISMSGLAKMCMSFGSKISGSDIGNNFETDKLEKMGIQIFHSHDAHNITSDIDFVIYSGAIHDDNPEIMEAKRLNIAMFERSEFLGEIAKMYSNVIAISGTHGKTTTTAMLSWIFECAGLNPTVHLGGESLNFSTNTKLGSLDYLVVEACEYRESFRFLRPNVSIINNVECDHMDYYHDYQDIYSAFQRFADASNIIVEQDGLNLKTDNVINIGKDFLVTKSTFQNHGYNFQVEKNGEFYGEFRINVIGEHNVTNALFAIAVADYFGISKTVIFDALSKYKGVKRRYELIGEIYNTPVIIDYAHHPTEIASSIRGLKSVYSEILVIFQPHTYSRTQMLFDDFTRVLKDIEHLILYKTYPARESEIIGGRAEDLGRVLKVPVIDNLEDLETLLKTESDNASVIAVLGAGDLADKIKSILTLKTPKNF